jgi:hypothetical protein
MPPRVRAVRPPSAAPPPYTPAPLPLPTPTPDIPIPQPGPTMSFETRELLINGAKGVRAYACGEQWLAGKTQYFNYSGLRPNDFWYVIELCVGECDALLDVTIDGNAPDPSKFEYWWYPGTAAGAVDSHLHAIDSTWNEEFAGTCNVVVHLMDFDGYWNFRLPNAIWHMRTRKVLQPATLTFAYSTDVWDQWYDFLRWSEGKALPSTRVDTAAFAAAKAADVAAGRSNACHMLLLDETDPNDVINAFRLMASAFYFFDDTNKYTVVADRAGAAVVATYGDHEGLRSKPVSGAREDAFDKPNKMTIWHTDVSNANRPLISISTPDPVGVPIKEEEHRLPWLYDPTIVQRQLTYFYNALLYDLQVEDVWNDLTAARKLGDVVTLQLPARGRNFTARIIGRDPQPDNTFLVRLLEHNEAKFGGAAGSSTAKTPSTFPDPGATPDNVNLSTVTIGPEEVFVQQPGFTMTRAPITFTNPASTFFDHVDIFVSINGGGYRYDGRAPSGAGQVVTYLFNNIMDLNVPYTFKFVSVSKFDQKSSGVTKNATFVGKTAPPSDVPLLYTLQLGPDVKVVWQRAADPDILGYEIRRGTTSDTWSTAQLVHQVGANTLYYIDKPPNSGGVAGGVWRYFIKAIAPGSTGKLYSANAKTDDIAVFNAGPALEETAVGYGIHGIFSSDSQWETGNALFEGQLTQKTMRAMLCRRLSPATSDSELHAASYTSIQQWETNVDAPRRNGQALWAPLDNQNESGTFPAYAGVGGSFYRNRELRSRVGSMVRVGLDSPDIVTRAEPLLILKTGGGGYVAGPTVRSGPNGPGGSFVHGFRLSSNSKYAQTMMIAPSFSAIFVDTMETLVQAIGEFDVVTDGSGVASLTLPAAQQLSAGCTLSVTPKILGTSTAVGFKLTTVNNASFSVKVVDDAGAAVAGVTVRCTVEDRGLGGSLSSFSV